MSNNSCPRCLGQNPDCHYVNPMETTAEATSPCPTCKKNGWACNHTPTNIGTGTVQPKRFDSTSKLPADIPTPDTTEPLISPNPIKDNDDKVKPDTPMGVSEWITYGKRYGYYDFAVGKASAEAYKKGYVDGQIKELTNGDNQAALSPNNLKEDKPKVV